jgi:tRNA pseudouridine38-40 synthase
MRNIALTVSYDGTDWAGFQRQNIYPSIQGELEKALQKLCGHGVTVSAAGRTDAGVHAFGQVVNFFTPTPVPIEKVAWVTNRWLPDSIRVRKARDVDARFHARHCAVYRRYWYFVQEVHEVDAMRSRFCWQIKDRLNVDAMKAATTEIMGRHDFSAFCHSGSPALSNVKNLIYAGVRRQGSYLIFDVKADAFLYQMVRLLVGNFVRIGRGEKSPEWMGELLETKTRHFAEVAAPTNGLWLMRVGYPRYNNIDIPVGDLVGETEDEELSG